MCLGPAHVDALEKRQQLAVGEHTFVKRVDGRRYGSTAAETLVQRRRRAVGMGAKCVPQRRDGGGDLADDLLVSHAGVLQRANEVRQHQVEMVRVEALVTDERRASGRDCSGTARAGRWRVSERRRNERRVVRPLRRCVEAVEKVAELRVTHHHLVERVDDRFGDSLATEPPEQFLAVRGRRFKDFSQRRHNRGDLVHRVRRHVELSQRLHQVTNHEVKVLPAQALLSDQRRVRRCDLAPAVPRRPAK
mmetsp:Transcript_30828/g.91711  ORF Transcript_30828/g.91711 Transcript_30828/m.91711 type:complete len:248 (-) Transcript_30828:507-1250(-)